MGQGAVVAAVITACVAVVVAVVAQVSMWTLEHHNRTYERRRSALLDMQDTALKVRTELRTLGPKLRNAVEATELSETVVVPEDQAASAARADAEALLGMYLARVESGAVETSVRAWWAKARISFISLGDDDVTVRDEQLAWADMNEVVGHALTVPGWWRTRIDNVRARRRRRRQAPVPPSR